MSPEMDPRTLSFPIRPPLSSFGKYEPSRPRASVARATQLSRMSDARNARVETGGRRRARRYLTSIHNHPSSGWPFDRDFRHIFWNLKQRLSLARTNRTTFGLGPGPGFADGASPSLLELLHPCDDSSVVDVEKVISMRATGDATLLLRESGATLPMRPVALLFSPGRQRGA
jgi:hypothetical protein